MAECRLELNRLAPEPIFLWNTSTKMESQRHTALKKLALEINFLKLTAHCAHKESGVVIVERCTAASDGRASTVQ